MSQIDGWPWTLESDNVVVSATTDVHRELLRIARRVADAGGAGARVLLMPAVLSIEDLTPERFDTVIVAGADMQGRLFGRRLPARRFLADPAQGVDICTCVFVWDIAEEPGRRRPVRGAAHRLERPGAGARPVDAAAVPGGRGHGDLPGRRPGRARRAARDGAADDPAPAGRAGGGDGLRRADGERAGVLPVPRQRPRGAAARLPRPGADDARALGLQHRRAGRAGAVHPPRAPRDGRGRHPDLGLPGRVRAGPVGGEPGARRPGRDGRPPRRLQGRAEGDGAAGRPGGDVHGAAGRGRHGIVGARARVAVARRRAGVRGRRGAARAERGVAGSSSAGCWRTWTRRRCSSRRT